MRRNLLAFLSALTLLTALEISCKKDTPLQPTLPAHTPLNLHASFISTRWCRIEWTLDPGSHANAYLMLRDHRDTIFHFEIAGADTLQSLTDTALAPGSTHIYTLFRIVGTQHWDSAEVSVKFLDTTSDMIVWDAMMRICKANSSIKGICTTAPGDYWMSGWMPNDTGIYQLLHLKDGKFSFYDLQSDADVGKCFALNDTNVWVCGNGTLFNFDGRKTTPYGTWNGALPAAAEVPFRAVWASPDGHDVFAVGVGGTIVHRNTAGSWESMTSGTPVPLNAMKAFSSSDIYVAGGNAYEGDLIHFDGTKWNLIAKSVPPDSNLNVANMLDVWGESDDSLFLAGNGIFHLRGAKWEDRTPSSDGTYVNGICSLFWNNVIACGESGLVMHYNGEHWTNYDQFFDLSGTMHFNRVLMSAGEIYIVGADDRSSVILHGRQ